MILAMLEHNLPPYDNNHILAFSKQKPVVLAAYIRNVLLMGRLLAMYCKTASMVVLDLQKTGEVRWLDLLESSPARTNFVHARRAGWNGWCLLVVNSVRSYKVRMHQALVICTIQSRSDCEYLFGNILLVTYKEMKHTKCKHSLLKAVICVYRIGWEVSWVKSKIKRTGRLPCAVVEINEMQLIETFSLRSCCHMSHFQ